MTPEIKKIIEDMFDCNNGVPTIARTLRLSGYKITQYLKSTGRYRTRDESYKVRVNHKQKGKPHD